MMKCPKCHADNPETQLFCGACGTRIRGQEDRGHVLDSPGSGTGPKNSDLGASPTETLQASVHELSTGSTFAGRYQVIEELGHGGMGRVYKVLDTDIKEKIALKLLRPEIALDKDTVERFSNELKLARKISHRNVCRMFDLGRTEGTTFITMEFVPGQDLKRLIRQMGQLGTGRAVSIGKQICEGLMEAHHLGVVHRDLKPQNVMVDEDGNARIMDFGIARSLRGKGITGAGVMIGTPEYMSPEQVEGKEADQRSDIYSLGIILYEMLTGRVPFEGDTPFTIGVKHKSELPRDPRELNAQIPLELGRLALKCLEKDKAARFQSAEELHAELGRIEQGLPTTQRRVTTPGKPTSREFTVTFRLRKLLWPAAAVLAALVIAALLLWRPWASPEASPPAPQIANSVAVISFENLTGDPRHDGLIRAVPNLMITKFEAMGIPYVASWERLQDLVKQMGRSTDGPIGMETGVEACRREGIAVLVTGEVTKAGDMFVTNIKALDAGTMRSLASASSQGRGEESLFAQIDELAGRLYKDLDWASARAAEAAPIAELTTASMEAYEHYLRGWEFLRKVYLREAAEEFEKAVAIDPGFAMASWNLAPIFAMLGRENEAMEAIRKAKQNASKATEKERLYIEAVYAYFVELDLEKAIDLLQRLGQEYPKEKFCFVLLSQLQSQLGEYQRSLEVARKALALDPEFGEAHLVAGYAGIGLKDYGQAVFHLEKYAALNPREPNPHDSLGDAYFFMGRLHDALAGYAKAVELKPDFFMTYPKLAYVCALEEDYPRALEWIDKCLAASSAPANQLAGHRWKAFYSYWLGSAGRSLSHLQKAREVVVSQAGTWDMAVEDRLRAWLFLHLNRYELSRQANEAWFSWASKAVPQYLVRLQTTHGLIAGLIELKENDSRSAGARLAEMRSLIPGIAPPADQDAARRRADRLEIEILIQERKYDEAVAIFDKMSRPDYASLSDAPDVIASNLFAGDLKARALEDKGDLDGAIAEYERLTTLDPVSRGLLLIDPRSHYRLARLYEQKGLKAKAAARYRHFLKLWKDADPGTLELEEAKTRLAALTA